MVNKKIRLGMLAMVCGLVLAGCPTETENNSNNGNNTGNSDNNTGNTGEQTGGGDGKVTITLQTGSETGNIKLKLSNGTWNTSGAWDATQSSNLSGIMGSLLTTYAAGVVDNSKCTATVIENNSALNIELKNSDGLLEVSGEVYTVKTLNPVSFPYTSHGGVSLSEKFQVAGDPVSFVNKTRLYADSGDPWANGARKIIIRESQVTFWESTDSLGTSFVYTYNIDMWQSDYVGGQYCVTINVSNGRKTSGYNSPPSCITDKTSFTFRVETWNSSISIRQVNGGSFSETGADGWDSSFIK